MELKIGNRKIDFYNDVNVALRYDSVGSTFSFSFDFDPKNADHREMFRPGAYHDVTITHKDELLITGTLLSPKFKDGPIKEPIRISGYSKTGVLEDCDIPKSAYPLQSVNINLKNITEKILKPFGLKLIIDDSVSKKVGENYKNTRGGDTQTCKSYITELACQKHIIVTHDEKGNLVFTEAKTTGKPIFEFTTGQQGVTSMSLDFDGQKMHSDILLQRQAHHRGGNAGSASVKNPYVNAFRPKVARQSSGSDTDTALAARNLLSEELKAIPLIIELDSWELNGKIVRPNNTITIVNENIYLYQKTTFFIEQVEYKGDHNSEVATLTCYLPEVYNGATPKNIFA